MNMAAIDYPATAFEDVVQEADLVVDFVGGDTGNPRELCRICNAAAEV